MPSKTTAESAVLDAGYVAAGTIRDTPAIWQKLLEIQRDLKVEKGQWNSFGKYKYRSKEDILEAAKPLCHDRGLVIICNDEIMDVGGWKYVLCHALLVDTETKDTVSALGIAREPETKKGMDGSQITGTASSYARKYALNGLFLIDDTKDADTNECHTIQANAPKKAEKPQAKQEPELDMEAELVAEAEAYACGTVAELADVYNKYAKMNPAYIRDGGIFMKALSARKKEIQSQPKTTLF